MTGATVVHVVGAAILAGDRCLVAQRGPAMSHAGKWEFPGGKVERGERPEGALRRELREELDCEVRVGARIGRGELRYGGRDLVLDVYLCTLRHGTPQPSEHAALAWLSAGELHALDWADADRPIVPAVVAALGRSGPV